MDYREVIRSKNKILSIAILASIVLRGIVNAAFVGVQTVIGMVVIGLVLTGILLLLVKKINPIVMMYLMVALLTGISIALMIMFPTTTNYLMFFLAIFMIVLYEDIRPIALQCICSAACMVIFYFEYAEFLANTWSVDAMAMCIVYIISAMFVFWSLCRLTGKQFESLKKINAESNAARAGEHGKGFAVVAMEIRNLSENSAKFTEQIHGILKGIQESTTNVMVEIQTGQSFMEECGRQMENVDMSFKSISDNTAQVLSQAQMIDEQAKNLENLLERTLTDVNHISENVAATSSAMEEISTGIVKLHENVDVVVSGYNDINEITASLVEASR